MFNEAEILRNAAEILEEHGWCRGVLKNDEGCFCAQGALTAALVNDTDLNAKQLDKVLINNRVIIGALSEWVLRAAGSFDAALWVYNDFEARSAQDVIGSLRKAADAVDKANRRYIDGGEAGLSGR
jgi:hypothetical protein